MKYRLSPGNRLRGRKLLGRAGGFANMKTISALWRSAVARNFALVTSATLVAQVSNFAWTPFLTRLYTPEAFGILSVFVSVVMIVAQPASLRLEQAIVLARDESEASGLFVVSCTLVTCFAGAAFVAARVAHSPIAPVLLAGGVAASGLYLPLAARCARERDFRAVSAAQLIRVGTVVAAQGTAALLGAGATGLILGYLAGEIAASGALALRTVRLGRRGLTLLSPREAWTLVRRHREFPLYSTPQTVLNSVSQSLPALVLTACFGAPIAGAYWLALRVLVVPSNLVGLGFRQVYYEHACRLDRSGVSFYPALRSATTALAAGSCALVVGAALLARPAFGLLFGSHWLLAGEYAAVLAPWLGAAFANLPSVAVLPILGRQRFALMFDLVTLAVRMLALGCGALLASDLLAIALYSGAGFVLNLVLIAIVFGFVRRQRPVRVAETAGAPLDSTAPRYA